MYGSYNLDIISRQLYLLLTLNRYTTVEEYRGISRYPATADKLCHGEVYSYNIRSYCMTYTKRNRNM